MKPGPKAYIFLIAIFVFVLDRLTKYIVLKGLMLWQSIAIIPDIFHITLVNNKGAAFGLFRDQAVFFIAISVIAIIGILFFILKRHSISFALGSSAGLILGGTCGNLIDRIKFGYVIDFLDFRIWPVFNIADTAICLGAGILLVYLLLKSNRSCDASDIV